MSGLIAEPGLYANIHPDAYHGQLTATPSISRSIAHDIVTSCEAKAWWNSYLNPQRPPEKAEFNLGRYAHLIVLEQDRFDKVAVVIDADDFRTKEAKAARDRAFNEGKWPMLPKHRDLLADMADALTHNKEARDLLAGSTFEQTIVARDPVTGLMLKARPDGLREADELMLDYKTCSSALLGEFMKRAWEHGWYIQEPWYRDAYELATGKQIRRFKFICQEVEAPYLIGVHQINMAHTEYGRMHARIGINRWAEALARNVFPGYPGGVGDLPGYAIWQLKTEEDGGRLEPGNPSAKLLEAAKAWQAR